MTYIKYEKIKHKTYYIDVINKNTMLHESYKIQLI